MDLAEQASLISEATFQKFPVGMEACSNGLVMACPSAPLACHADGVEDGGGVPSLGGCLGQASLTVSFPWCAFPLSLFPPTRSPTGIHMEILSHRRGPLTIQQPRIATEKDGTVLVPLSDNQLLFKSFSQLQRLLSWNCNSMSLHRLTIVI
jgi:hypothetical protein